MRLILCYKNFAASQNISHIGLGVSALNTAKCLARKGEIVDVWAVKDGNELRQRLNLAKSDTDKITHVVISAPFIHYAGMQQLCSMFPRVQFAVVSHSNVGFLQADRSAVRIFRSYLALEAEMQNFQIAGNSEFFCQSIQDAYSSPCEWLPNLYYLDGMTRTDRPLWNGGVLKIGIFGATRVLKNMPTAVWSCIEIMQELKCETEIWINVGRDGSPLNPDGSLKKSVNGADATVLQSAISMVENLPGITLKFAPWKPWPEFRRIIASMHLLLQPSYTESFNMVTADGVSQGVASVVSDAIDWAPDSWKAKVDQSEDIAYKGRALLSDRRAVRDGLRALTAHNALGIQSWEKFLIS